MVDVVPNGSLLSFSALLYIFVLVFLSVLLLVWLFLCFLQLCLGSFVLSFKGLSYTSMCSDSIGDVLKMPMYIFCFPYICYRVILVSMRKLCCKVGNHTPFLIYILHCTAFKCFFSLLHTFCLLLP